MPHQNGILAVNGDSRHTVSSRAVGYIRDRCRVLEWSGLSVAVILADKYHRQVPDRGHVQAFMRDPDIRSALAEERHRHLLRFTHFGRQAGADCMGHARPHNRVHAENSLVRVGDMHRTAFSTVCAGYLSE